MSINAVQHYLRDVLTATLSRPAAFPLVGTRRIPPLQVIVGPSTIAAPHGPVLFVRSRTQTEKRLSGPPGYGTKHITHTIRMVARWQLGVGTVGGETAMDMFTAVVDTLEQTLRDLPRAVTIADPYTDRTSTFGLIADTIQADFEGPWAVADQRAQLYGANLNPIGIELLQG